MTHSICTSEGSGELAHFQHLWRTLLAPDLDPRTRLEQLFEHETAEFDLSYAFLSRIDLKDETERFEITYGSHQTLRPDTTVPLSDTYCRKTIADPEGTVVVSDALAEGWGGDPAYQRFELGSYLGTTVSIEDELYGTLCFANTAARDEPIRDKEKALVEMYGRWVEYTLASRGKTPVRGTRINTDEERTVPSKAIDSMMDALGKPTRRVVLTALSGDGTEVSLAALERRMNDENVRVQLIHIDLPKLADAEYITWDSDSGTVSKGPRFFEVEPIVQFLNERNAEFPE